LNNWFYGCWPETPIIKYYGLQCITFGTASRQRGELTSPRGRSGSFIIKIVKSASSKLGWVVQPSLQISLHMAPSCAVAPPMQGGRPDENILHRIKDYFGVGNLSKDRDYIVYSVKSVKDLHKVIIPFFEKYSLITQKNMWFWTI